MTGWKYGTKLVFEFSRSMRRPSEIPIGTKKLSYEPGGELGTEAGRDGAVEREILGGVNDPAPEIDAERHRTLRTLVHIAAAKAEIVGAAAEAVESLDRVRRALRIGERSAELPVLEGAVRRLEDRRAGLLRGEHPGAPGDEGEQDKRMRYGEFAALSSP